MDVICERCKAEYEFDEALLGEKGTTVKCSACGHVFRVLPPSRELARSHLKLRFAKDGTVKPLSSLRELQQRIRAGEVTLDDELGRDGFPFRPLRDVPELKNFFAPDSPTMPPNAGPGMLSGAHAARTVQGGVPGSAHATIAGHASGPPPRLPNERAAAKAQVDAWEARARAALVNAALVNQDEREPVEGEDLDQIEQFDQNVQSESEPQPGPQRGVALEEVSTTGRPAFGELSDAERVSDPGRPTSEWTPPESRPRSFGVKHTMMGVGPTDLKLPPPPRVPELSNGALVRSEDVRPELATEARPSRPFNDSPHGTLMGFVVPAGPSMNGDTEPDEPAPSLEEPSPGDEPNERAAPLEAEADAPAAPPEEAISDPVSELVAPHEVPSNTLEQDGAATFEPGVIALAPASASAQSVPHAAQQLHLSESEKPPPRAEGGSKAGLTLLLLAVLGGGGYLFWRASEGPEGEWHSRQDLEATAQEAPPPMATTPETAQPEHVAPLPGEPEPDPAADNLMLADPDPEPSEPLAQGALDGEEKEPAKPGVATAPAAAGSEPVAPSPAASPAAPEPKPEPVPTVKREQASEGQPATKQVPVANAEPAAKPVAKQGPAEKSSAPAGAEPAAKPAAAPKPYRPSGELTEAAAKPVGPSERIPLSGDYDGWVNKGDQLYARGDNEGAQKAFRSALAVRPQGSEANAGLGFALYAAGKAREALPYFDAAATSGYADGNIGLGDCYRKLGQPSPASEAYQAYLDRLPRGKRAEYARTQIEKIKSGVKDDAPAAVSPAIAPAASTSKGNDGYRPAGEMLDSKR